MATIKDLSFNDTPQSSDSVPIYGTSSGTTQRTSINKLVQGGLSNLPTVQPVNGSGELWIDPLDGNAIKVAGPANASASSNLTQAVADLINGTADDASTLTGAENVPMNRSAGLLQTSLTKIAQWVIQTYQGFTQSGTGAVARTVQDALRDQPVHVASYGADPTGVADSSAAIQNALNANSVITLGAGTYLIGSEITVPSNRRIIGNGAKLVGNFSTAARFFSNTNATNIGIRGINFDMRYSVTGFGVHCISFLNPSFTSVEDCTFTDWYNAAVLFYTDDLGASGVATNNVINVRANGKTGNEMIGVIMESMRNSRMDVIVSNVKNSGLGYGVNFKNKCTNCFGTGIISDCLNGLVLSDDQTPSVGSGVNDSSFNFAINNCTNGILAGQHQNCHVDATIDGGGIAGGYAVYVTGYGLNNSYAFDARNCDAAGYAIRTRSDNQTFKIRDYDNSALKIALLEAGTDRNRFIVEAVPTITGNGANIAKLFDNDASNVNNEVVYLRDAAYCDLQTGAGGIVIPKVSAAIRTDNSFQLSSSIDALTTRVGGSGVVVADLTNAAFYGATNGAYACGRPTVNWSGVYSQKYYVGSTQVVGAQITGYGTPTGNSRTASFNGASATLAQTSAQLAQLIVDLKTHGLLGA